MFYSKSQTCHHPARHSPGNRCYTGAESLCEDRRTAGGEAAGASPRAASAPFTVDTVRIRAMTVADLPIVRRIEEHAYNGHPPRTPFEREIRNGLAAYSVLQWGGTQRGGTQRGGTQRGGTQPPPQTLSAPGRAARLLRRAGSATDRDRPILGFLGLWFLGDQLHITTIATDPLVQGRRVASHLMLCAFDTAEESGLRTLALEVRASNERARAIYERFGLREVGRRRRYYSDNGEDAVIMVTESIETEAMQQRIARLREALQTARPPADEEHPG